MTDYVPPSPNLKVITIEVDNGSHQATVQPLDGSAVVMTMDTANQSLPQNNNIGASSEALDVLLFVFVIVASLAFGFILSKAKPIFQHAYILYALLLYPLFIYFVAPSTYDKQSLTLISFINVLPIIGLIIFVRPKMTFGFNIFILAIVAAGFSSCSLNPYVP